MLIDFDILNLWIIDHPMRILKPSKCVCEVTPVHFSNQDEFGVVGIIGDPVEIEDIGIIGQCVSWKFLIEFVDRYERIWRFGGRTEASND